ncbi:DUF4855 domain-containing protein [Alicyclobacillus fastidiosus]|uniref:DUF4855 domain-containing protein n=1 Tax=Alicyclobacillus fastidiosus TaxID=392011 RepID=A0ABY6ZFA3_9BACL|nr:DUF4855 domain-containing protein [Alicyclobacillus fastidiosus]WAH41517.1 DUF4855 domain-containing protein [Alicyclobacillus fastidiosus]GMA63167.1 hypothetical protein GCM10025859_36070 [Alicyclobacillus fastidiosus]
MRKSVMTAAVTALLLAGVQLMVGTAYAGTGAAASSTSEQDVATSGPAASQQGADSEVLRPGANPNNPNDYPYLPSNMPIPVAGPRTQYPKAPSANSTGTTDSSATDSTDSIMSPSDAATTPPSPADPTTLPDIALGKSYTIGTQWPDATFEQNEASYVNTGQLTDGQYASLSFTDKQWVGLSYQGGRSIVVNLGSVQPIREVSLDFLQNLGAGIVFPDSVTYYASDDGTSWHKIGTAWSGQGGGDYTPQTQAYTVNTNIDAQYIRAQFTDKIWSFVDQFAVFGGQPAAPAVGPAAPAGLVTNPGPFPGPSLTTIMGDDYLDDPNAPGLPSLTQLLATLPSSSGTSSSSGSTGPSVATSLAALAQLQQLAPGVWDFLHSTGQAGPKNQSGYLMANDPGTGGIHNMQIVYTGSGTSTGEWNESDFLPMISQENANGTPTGWLFDGTLFDDYSSNTPETEVGWTTWLTDLFSPKIELSALDQAVGQVKQELNDPNFKEKVVITIPSTEGNSSDFGEVDGQSLDLNPADVGQVQSTINKAKAIHWYMQQVLSMWNQADFSNLQLAGFYWEPESVDQNLPLDQVLIQTTAAMVHQDHLNFYWIPYDGAVDVADWRQLGFDNVTSQVGVAFNYSINAAERLQSVAEMAQFYHMGLEMEQPYNMMSTNPTTLTEAQEKWDDYFTGGYVYGYEGDVMKTWYLNSKGLVQPAESTNPLYRKAYDDAVSFVNDEWTQTTFY